jgi:hypothetical protein
MGAEAKPSKTGELFYKRMRALGYKDTTEFVRAAKIDLSFETCRRALHEGRFNIRHEYVVRLMQALDFTPQEIAEELKRRGDEHLHRLVESSAIASLSASEERLIKTIREAKIPGLAEAVVQLINVMARGGSANSEEQKSSTT